MNDYLNGYDAGVAHAYGPWPKLLQTLDLACQVMNETIARTHDEIFRQRPDDTAPDRPNNNTS